jgi:hypothetical protein
MQRSLFKLSMRLHSTMQCGCPLIVERIDLFAQHVAAAAVRLGAVRLGAELRS